MHVHLETPSDTLWAVIVGAVLATLGGFVATQFEHLLASRRRERAAALLFGEILSALNTITQIASKARVRGEPYGAVTLRLLRAVRRETETYGANRSSLYDLRDATVRIRIHVLMVQAAMAVEGVTDATAELALGCEGAARERLEGERDTAFDFLIETAEGIPALIAALEPRAGLRFADLKPYSGDPFD